MGSGFMIGTPYQRVAELADEFAFLLRQLAPDIMMVDTFLAANGTPFEQERNGMPDLTYLILSLLRLSFPDIYLPSITDGRAYGQRRRFARGAGGSRYGTGGSDTGASS